MNLTIKSDQPKGMVLFFALGVLALLAILGSTIFLATKDELLVASEMTINREAFAKADSTAHIALFLARAAVVGSSAGKVEDTIQAGGVGASSDLKFGARPEFVVVVNNFSEEKFLKLDNDMITNEMVKNRYILAAAGDSGTPPHVEVYYQYNGDPTKRQLIGTAAVAVGVPTAGNNTGTDNFAELGSQGEQNYEDGNASTAIYFLISANGRMPLRGKGDSTVPKDPSNYFDGDHDAKNSFVTLIYREIL